MDKYQESFWVNRPEMHSFLLFPAGNYDPGKTLDFDEAKAVLQYDEVFKLIDKMNERNMIPKEVNQAIRDDDIDITHRHLDIIEELVGDQE